jgi:hypothetical protein
MKQGVPAADTTGTHGNPTGGKEAMENTTAPAGETAYTIQRAFIHDSATVNAATTRRGEIVLNVGAVAMHLSPETARAICTELTIARIWHDLKHEDGAE